MLEGKSAIVTGAGQGLGRAIAKILAERGVSLVVNGRVPAKLESLQEEIRAKGRRIEIVPGDVGSWDDVAGLVERALAGFGGIDVLANNAQTTIFNVSVLDLEEKALELPFRSGVLRTLYCMQACYPHLKARGGGSIVKFGSSTARSPPTSSLRKDSGPVQDRGARMGSGRHPGQRHLPGGPDRRTAGVDEELPARLRAGDAGHPAAPDRRPGGGPWPGGRALADDLGYLTGATLMLDGGHLMTN